MSKSVYSDIMRLAMEISREENGGIPSMVKGAQMKAARRYYAEHKIAQPFDKWLSAVRSAGMKSDKPKEKTLQDRYRDLVNEHDVLPKDPALAAAWGCDPKSTISSIRSVLRKEGYDFDVGADVVTVTLRPEPETISDETPRPATVPINGGVGLMERLDVIIVLLTRLTRVWDA